MTAVDATGRDLTVIGAHEGVEWSDWIAENGFGVGGKKLHQPKKAQLIEALIEDDGEAMIWGHGGAGHINFGTGESLNANDIRYIARERKRRGKGKLKRVWLRSCHACEDKDWVNAWLEASDEVFGYTSITTDGPMQSWRSPVTSNPAPQNWWWSFGKKKVKNKKKAKADQFVEW